jgi:hypothetical protein
MSGWYHRCTRVEHPGEGVPEVVAKIPRGGGESRLSPVCIYERFVGPRRSPMEEEKEENCWHFLAIMGVKWLSISPSQNICAGAKVWTSCMWPMRGKKRWLRLQRIPLYGIALGQTITDPFNQMILISKWITTYVRYDRVILGHMSLDKSDSINGLIPLSVIPLSGFHCTIKKVKVSKWKTPNNSFNYFAYNKYRKEMKLFDAFWRPDYNTVQ